MRDELINAITNDPEKDKIVAGICNLYKYRSVLPGVDGRLIDNPESPVEFAAKVICNFISGCYRAYKLKESMEASKQITIKSAEYEVNL